MMRRWLWGAAVFAVLWMGWALLLAFIAASDGLLARAVALVPGVPGIFYGWSFVWAFAGGALTALLVALAYLLIGWLLAGASRPSFAVGWLAAILAAVVVGAALDLPSLIRGIGMFGIRGLGSEPFNMQRATFWTIFAGWIPALIVSRGRTKADAGRRTRPLAITWMSTLVAAAVLVGVGLAGDAAANAQRAQSAQEQTEAEQTAVGILPDPEAPGEPVPLRAATSDPVPEGACTPENAALLIGTSDAATGHRGQTIQLMNFSDEPCVIEGYPDIAFADQNARELTVSVEHGRSFMAEDPGPVRIELAAQGTVTAAIGWDANSTHGALVTHTVYAAIRAGEERGSWPAILDIVEGSTVHVTAWQETTTPLP